MKVLSTVAAVIEATGGVLRAGSADTTFENIVIDSRKAGVGDLFVAIRGANFDGHWFIEETFRAGAVGAIIEPDIIIFEIPLLPPEFVVIEVRNTLAALQKVAAAYRKALPMRVVGVTGSNGKTSVKDFISTIAASRFKVESTAGNLNNHIGVPLSILKATPETEVGVFELGMNHAGEIAPLAQIIAPEIAVITNIGVAHIENLGSRESIFEEKSALARSLPDSGVLVYDAEDDFASKFETCCPARKISVGFEKGDIRAANIEATEDGMRFELRGAGIARAVLLPVHGKHMVRNALLAAAVGSALGMSLEECAAGLAKVEAARGRLQKQVLNGVTIFDDTYNANPDSVQAAILVLAGASTRGKRIAVLGTMGELGDLAVEGHRRIGEACGKSGVDLLIAVGEHSQIVRDSAAKAGCKAAHAVETTDQAVHLLRANVQVGDVMLVKGSRAAKMEKVIEGLSS